jgi:membrane-bound serine protease (ClpP class)
MLPLRFPGARALLVVAVGIAAALASPPAAAETSTVQIAKVSGALDRPNVDYLLSTLAAAESAGHTVVLQLDTAGTLDRDAVALAERIFHARVPVIVWVGPAPARASGGGLLLMHAASLAAVSPGAQTGPLRPIDLAYPERAYPGLGRRMETWVEARGTPTVLGGRDRPLTAAEARHRNIAQVAALSVPELLAEIDGRTVRTSTGPVTLRTAIASSPDEGDRVVWRFGELGPVRRVLHAMISPSAIYLFLVLGLAALAFELTQPGFGFAGFSGIAMLLLAGYGLFAVPFSGLGLLLTISGVVLLGADVWIRRLGVLTWAGLGVFAAGSVLLFRGVSSQIDLSPWFVGSLTVASALYYGFGLTVALQARDRIASAQRGLIGLVGEARGDLAPEGPVFVKGTLWRGRASQGHDRIDKGARIRVRGVDGLVLTVEAEPAPPGGADGLPDPEGA